MISHHLNKAAAVLMIFMAFPALVGCTMGTGAKPTYDGWKASIQNHINTRGDGDINSLRSSDSESDRIVFNVIGSERPEKSTDVNSLLLGRRTVGDQDWYIFIVGTVKAGDVKDIRVAVLRSSSGNLIWNLGSENDSSTATYRTAKQVERFQGASSPIGFPLEEDRFSIEITGNIVSVVEAQSAARWSLQLK